MLSFKVFIWPAIQLILAEPSTDEVAAAGRVHLPSVEEPQSLEATGAANIGFNHHSAILVARRSALCRCYCSYSPACSMRHITLRLGVGIALSGRCCLPNASGAVTNIAALQLRRRSDSEEIFCLCVGTSFCNCTVPRVPDGLYPVIDCALRENIGYGSLPRLLSQHEIPWYTKGAMVLAALPCYASARAVWA
jgi:hypothetical protein